MCSPVLITTSSRPLWTWWLGTCCTQTSAWCKMILSIHWSSACERTSASPPVSFILRPFACMPFPAAALGVPACWHGTNIRGRQLNWEPVWFKPFLTISVWINSLTSQSMSQNVNRWRCGVHTYPGHSQWVMCHPVEMTPQPRWVGPDTRHIFITFIICSPKWTSFDKLRQSSWFFCFLSGMHWVVQYAVVLLMYLITQRTLCFLSGTKARFDSEELSTNHSSQWLDIECHLVGKCLHKFSLLISTSSQTAVQFCHLKAVLYLLAMLKVYELS